MALDFPSSPTNGQTYNGWVYSSSKGAWQLAQTGLAMTVSATAPSYPNNGDQWYNLNTGQRFTWVNDGDSTQWVQDYSVIMNDTALDSRITAIETTTIRSIGLGGTGSATAAGALTNLGAAAASHTHDGSAIVSGTVPIAYGGTGTTNGVGMVRVIPTSVGVSGGTASFNGTTGAITFSAATNVQPNGVFSSSYKYYRVVTQFTASVDTGYGWRLAAGGSWNSNSYYHFVLQWNGGSGYGASPVNSGSLIGYSLAHKFAGAVMDFINPAVTASTKHMIGHWQGLNAATSANESHSAVGVFRDTAWAADGFALFPSTGNITGTMTVYGYN